MKDSNSTSAEDRALTAAPRSRRRLFLIALAAVILVASVFGGQYGLIPFGLLLAFSADDEEKARRSVTVSLRNLGLAFVMAAVFTWFWLWQVDLEVATIVLVGGALIAMPLALQETAGQAASARTVTITKRSLILSISALVVFVALYSMRGENFTMLTAVCIMLPLVLAASRAWGVRRGRIELGLLRHPLRRDLRPHLVQAFNIWLCCALLGCLLAVGGAHFARVGYSLNTAQFNVVMVAFAAGLVVLAALVVVPRRRVFLATNALVALVSGFLVLQLVQISVPPADAIALDSPLTGEWYVSNAGRSELINGHSPNESNSLDFHRMGANGRTHTGGSGAPLSDYAGFGQPVLSPAEGQIVEVQNDFADTSPGTNGDYANSVVLDIGDDRFVVMGHLEQGSVKVRVGDVVRRGQQLAAVGNTGHTNEPHLHFQIQDTPTGDAMRTYPIVFRNVHITKGGAWPRGDGGELRTGDFVTRRSSPATDGVTLGGRATPAVPGR